MKYYLAIDIGASSGRHIVGWKDGGRLMTEEVYRFPNGVVDCDGSLTWDVESIVESVKTGIARAKEKYPDIVSLSIDTWGVDYVLLHGEEAILPVYAYRDERTTGAIDQVHRLIPFSDLYRWTGIQFQPFNSIYQMYADKLAGRLQTATDYLMIPEYLMYRLCGVRAHEYTNATTSGMVNAKTGEINQCITEKLGFPEHLFTKLSAPGTVLGEYSGIKVMLCATHDTASAVEGIPMEEESPYISSGTWSLLGVKTTKPLTDEKSQEANYSNEGGVGYNRYQKNIMGLWVVNELRKELCPGKDFGLIAEEAACSTYDGLVDVNDSTFLAPRSMQSAFDEKLEVKPESTGDYFRCAYRSLANSYRQALDELETNTGKKYAKLYIVGGGAKNKYLNRLTEEMTGKQVVALPIEATALGNLKIQMEAEE